MSYNVDKWKTKKLDQLRIPWSSFFKHERKDWHPKFEDVDDGTLDITNFEFTLTGRRLGDDGDIFEVDEIDIHGEGSGTFINWILEPALEDSTGELIAVRIWEGGDSVDRLTVKDGELSSEEVEL